MKRSSLLCTQKMLWYIWSAIKMIFTQDIFLKYLLMWNALAYYVPKKFCGIGPCFVAYLWPKTYFKLSWWHNHYLSTFIKHTPHHSLSLSLSLSLSCSLSDSLFSEEIDDFTVRGARDNGARDGLGNKNLRISYDQHFIIGVLSQWRFNLASSS